MNWRRIVPIALVILATLAALRVLVHDLAEVVQTRVDSDSI